MVSSKTVRAASKSDDDSKARIIAAARRSFASMGFEGASTRQIAAEAGVAQSLLLYHFGSKDALWRAVMDDLFAGLNARMAQAQAAVVGGTLSERLMAIVTGFIDLSAENADIHRIMTVEGRHETDRLKWLVERHLRENYVQACALIRRSQEAGVVRAGDPTLLYYTFIAIAGTAFSLAPEIRLVSQNERAVDPSAVAALIRSLLIVRDE
jgi:TetR/AcrR family transcriptional regulator